MTLLQLDFVERKTRPYAAVAFLLAGTLSSLHVLGDWLVVRSELDLLRERTEAAQVAVTNRRASITATTAAAEQKQQAEAVRVIDAMLAYRWNRVFADIEQRRPENLGIVSFQHSQASGRSELTVEANSVEAIAKLVNALNQDGRSRYWYIASYKMPSKSSDMVQAVLLQR